MKKKILIILAIIFITLIAVLYFSFGKQYKAASSVHLVSDGMYEYTSLTFQYMIALLLSLFWVIILGEMLCNQIFEFI